MANAPYTTQRTTSSTGSEQSTTAYRAVYAAERAKLLFGGYRRGDANDPDTYVASIAAVLACYDAEIIKQVTDPRTGISTHEKFVAFMPNSGELKAYCEGIASRRDRVEQYAQLQPPRQRLPPPPPGPGDFANVFVRSDAPQYAAMVERAKTAEPREWRWDETRRGIWVMRTWLEPGTGAQSTWKALSDSDLRAIYGRAEAEIAREAAE